MGRAVTAPVPGPVMVAAGCGGTGRELAPFVDMDGLDFVTRTITLDARQGFAGPRVEETASGLLHAGGLPNPGLEHFLATELPWLVRAGTRVHVSIAARTLGDFADLARRLSRAPGVAGLEVDLGEPDEEGLALFEVREPYHAASVIAAVRREFSADRPVLAKLRPDVSRIVESARGCHEAGATAVVVGHALPAAMSDGRVAGLSGPAIAPVVRRSVAEVHRVLKEVPVIASGGVDGPVNARSHLAAGACGVQVGSSLLRDPSLLRRLQDSFKEES